MRSTSLCKLLYYTPLLSETVSWELANKSGKFTIRQTTHCGMAVCISGWCGHKNGRKLTRIFMASIFKSLSGLIQTGTDRESDSLSIIIGFQCLILADWWNVIRPEHDCSGRKQQLRALYHLYGERWCLQWPLVQWAGGLLNCGR